MRGDLTKLVLLHGAAKDVVAVSQGACEGVGGGPAILLVEVPNDGAFPRPWAHANATAAALVYAMGKLGPVGPPAEPPKAKTPKVQVATPHTPLRDRKKELRRLKADKARAARLVKRFKSRDPFMFKEGTMELNGQSFPIRDVKIEMAQDASVRDAHFYQRTRELLHPK